MTAEDQIRAERDAIERAISGLTVADVLARNAGRHPDRPALSWKEGGRWWYLTWRTYREQVQRVAMGLADLGVAPGEFVVIMARNRPEHLIADLAVMHAGATPVSLYNTLAAEQVAYIAGHCEATVAILEGEQFVQRFEKIRAELPALRHVVVIEDAERHAADPAVVSWSEVRKRGKRALHSRPGELERRVSSIRPEDTATLVYTSGTTGPPKGVVITHRNVLWISASLDLTGSYPEGLRAVSYLPLAHALERVATHYLAMWKAAHIYMVPEVLQIFDLLPEIHPDAFAGVPRVWEKVQAGILRAIADEPNERRRGIALAAIDVGRQVARLEAAGEPVPLALAAKRAAADRVVLSKIRRKLGLDRAKIVVSGAAPLSREVLEFFWGIGVPLREGYGMTENVAPATLNTEGRTRVGTVGRALPGVEVRLAADGEVLLRGGLVVPGYYRDPERTAETFDAEGWLHTGDIGALDDEGFLRIVDRKKELIITAGGKNISPANLESLLKRHPLVGQACAVGEGRPYMTALLVLDAEVAPGWARDNGVSFTDLATFSREARVHAEVQRGVVDANQHVSQAERIKRFSILPVDWTAESEELTPTLKLKRRVIHAKYAEEIEQLYR